MTIKSTLAVDMGGRYTGVFSYTTASGFPEPEETQAYVLNMPDNDALTYSTATRTQTRHRLRSQQRFVLARRLMYILIEEKLNRKLTPKEKEAISSLLRRRGYSRLESELDLSVLSGVENYAFKGYLTDLDEDESLLNQWNALTDGYLGNNLECHRKIEEFLERASDAEILKSYLKEMNISGRDETKDYQNALKIMREDAENIRQQTLFGHKHRRTYLEDIAKDIPHDSRLKEIVQAFDGSKNLRQLIGNISNLQLRALRWYFNDPSMKNDLFDQTRLKNVLTRAYKFFHYPKETIEQGRKVIDCYEKSDDILKTLQTMDPVLTIPPYEDQNNRRPPLDQTLWLSPKRLDERYGDTWEIWVQNLLRSPSSKGIDENLDAILVTTDRKERLHERQNGHLVHYTTRKLYHSYVLQRLLDRTAENDVYMLKALVSPNRSNANCIDEALVKLKKDLGSQHIEKFLDFVQKYFKEVDKAKRGLWFAVSDPIMEKADIHPPMKSDAVVQRLVNNILCVTDLPDLRFWNIKAKGRSTVRSLCALIEKTRKEYGNSFNYLYQKTLHALAKGQKLTAEDKVFAKVNTSVNLASETIAQTLNITDEQRAKFANPFSLSQLYNIIETERNGFISTTLAALDENAWRNNLQGKARCVQLCADTVRPFDSALRKILDRQAYEIAKVKSEELISSGIKNQSIDLVILLESNQFAFSASLAEIKKSANTAIIRRKTEQAQKRQQDRWLSKTDRIKSAIRNICPYTGKTLSDKGEIDHIIPRSLSMNFMGAILNSEANLIYCSQEGNQLKLKGRKNLSDLASNYLTTVFGTADCEVIQREIENTIEGLSDNKITQFELLNQKQQDAIRHALFLEDFNETRRRVIRLLGRINTARVNGTQAWFAKSFITKIQDLTRKWCLNNHNTLNFDLYKLDAQNVSQNYRNALAELNEDWRKPDDQKQPIASHAIDALCVFAAAKDKPITAKALGILDNVNEKQNLDQIAKLMPTEINLISPKRQSIFDKDDVGSRALMKEGIYAEHFLPILVKDDEYRIGFDWSETSSVKVKNGKKLFGVLRPFLKQHPRHSRNGSTIYKVDHKRAFELLHEVFIKPCPKEMLEQAQLLEKLYYVTQNIPATSIYDVQKRCFKTENEILKEKDFCVKVDLGTKFGTAKGKILLPVRREWGKLLNRAELKNLIGQKVPDGEKRIYDIFNHGRQRKLAHKASKRVWSLPKLATASGGIRIKRKDAMGKDIYQLYVVNKEKCKGFIVDEKGSIDWKTDLIADFYNQATLTILNGRYHKADNYVRMDHWLKIDCGRNDIEVRMCPGTKDRCYVEITQDKKQFEDWTGYSSANFWTYPDTISLSTGQVENFIGNSQLQLLGEPRNGKIALICIGEKLKYWYTVTGTNELMKTAYQKAFSASLEK